MLDDKTLTNEEVQQLLARGYKPVGRGGEVYYCRHEQRTGSRFETTSCKTADEMKRLTQESKDMLALTSVGRGTPLSTATLSDLHQTLPEFTARYQEFSRPLLLAPDFHQILADLPETVPSMPEPAQLSSEQAQSLMKKLCIKLQNCRK